MKNYNGTATGTVFIDNKGSMKMDAFKSHPRVTFRMPRKGAKTVDTALIEAVLGLAGEVGELTNLVKKLYRDNRPLDDEETQLELGDILHYTVVISNLLGYNLDAIMYKNIKKLEGRTKNE